MVMQENFRVVVLIPAYKPDERLIHLTRELRDEKLDVLLVDDGGGEQYAPIFEQCRALGAEGFCQFLVARVNYGHVGPLAGKLLHDSGPDPTGAARHQGDFSGKVPHALTSCTTVSRSSFVASG